MKSSRICLAMMISTLLSPNMKFAHRWCSPNCVFIDDPAGSSVDPEIVIQQGHLSEVSAVAFVNDGQQLVSASLDGTIRVWSVQNRKLEKILRVTNHVLSPPRITTSPDGKLLAAKIADEEIGIWDVSSWTKISACRHQYVRFFKFSRDSSTLAGTAGTKIFLCDAHGAAPERELELERTPLSFTFNSDGTEIATATGDEDIQRWNTKTGEELKTLSGHTGHVLAVEFSPREHVLASASSDKSARLWNTDTGEGQVLTTDLSAVLQVSFSSDGDSLVTKNEDGQVKVWDTRSRKLIATLGSSVQSGTAAISPDGIYLGIVDQRSVLNLNLTTQELRQFRLKTNASRVIAYDPKSRLMAVGDGADPEMWDLKAGTVGGSFGHHTRRLKSLGISADGVELAAADSAKVTIWNFNTGAVRTFSPQLIIPGRALLTLSPDHSILAIHSDKMLTERTVSLWKIDGGKMIASINDSPGPPLIFSRTSSYFADIDSEGNAKVSNLEGKEMLAIPQMTDLRALAFSPSDRLLAAIVAQNRIEIWELPVGRPPRTIDSTYSGNILYFASDDVLVRLKNEKAMETWNLRTGERTSPPQIPPSVAHKWIASLKEPNEIDIFDLDSRKTVMHANLPTTAKPIAVAEWNPQTQILGTESEIGELALWKLREGNTAKKVCSLYVYDDGNVVVLNADGLIDDTRVCRF